MGSEQRRLKAGFVPKSDDQDEMVVLGLREEDEDEEPHSLCVDVALSPTSMSPSGSVLSYAES